MNMNILITGSNGQLGSELKKILREGLSELGTLPLFYTGCRVTALDVDILDITNLNMVLSFFDSEKPDLVFNCAAMTNVDGCETNEETAYKVNATGPANLATACDRYNSRLLHVSTDYVFSGDGNRPYTEKDMPSPTTAYGRTKLAGEIAVLQNCKNSCICRTAWLYGYEGNNFVKTMLRLAKEKGTLTVVDDQVGNPTCAVDLAYQLVLLGSSSLKGIFHCTCNGSPVSWHAFAERIVKDAGLDVPVLACTTDQFPRPAKRPAYSALDNAHLKSTIGDSLREWDVALDSFMKSYLAKEQA
jgi:dTDP-4-dehydrorhamnose reductase